LLDDDGDSNDGGSVMGGGMRRSEPRILKSFFLQHSALDKRRVGPGKPVSLYFRHVTFPRIHPSEFRSKRALGESCVPAKVS